MLQRNEKKFESKQQNIKKCIFFYRVVFNSVSAYRFIFEACQNVFLLLKEAVEMTGH